MCRLAYISDVKVGFDLDSFLVQLQFSAGGDGDGMIFGDRVEVDVLSYKSMFEMSVGGRKVKKILPEHRKGLIEYSIRGRGELLYHTRLASASSVSLMACHPAVERPWFVMQNGHEEHLMRGGTPDYEMVARMLSMNKIKVEALLYLTSSNWMIYNENEDIVYIVSAKDHDPLCIYENDDVIVIASELPDGADHKEWRKFVGWMVVRGEKIVFRDTIWEKEWRPPIIRKHYYKLDNWY